MIEGRRVERITVAYAYSLLVELQGDERGGYVQRSVRAIQGLYSKIDSKFREAIYCHVSEVIRTPERYSGCIQGIRVRGTEKKVTSSKICYHNQDEQEECFQG